MEDRRLNLNAPLLSVRRSLTVLGGGKVKKVENSQSRKQHSRSISKADSLLDEVTEPVSVPFHWEQIPGTVKDGQVPNRQAHREASVRVPPGRKFSVARQELERKDQDTNLRRPNRNATDANSAKDSVAIDCFKDGSSKNEEDENEDDDIYSDALETLSATDSVSMNCSANGLSTLDGFAGKPAGTFSVDPQTRDLMMSRFLPAAKAMALEPAHHASRKQLMPVEKPKPIRTVTPYREGPVYRQRSPDFHLQDQVQDTEEEESEDDYNENTGSIPIKGWGLIPRLCAKNSLCILNPIPGIRTRRVPSSNNAEKPMKSAYSRSRSSSPTGKKHMKDDKRKAYSGILSPRLPQVENRLLNCGSNRFGNTSERKSVSRSLSPLGRSGWTSPFRNSRCTSPNRCEPTQSTNSMSRRITSTLRRLRELSPSRRSACVSPNRNEPTQLTNPMSRTSSPLRRSGGNSPFRRSGCISPHGNEPARSPFQVGGSLSLGLRREAESSIANKLSLYNGSNTRSQELLPHRDNKTGVGSSRYTAEKTLYVDTVNRMTKLSRTILQVTGSRTSARNDSKSLPKSGEIEETASTESSFQELGSTNTNEEEKDMEKQDSMKVLNQGSKALVRIKTSTTQNINAEACQARKEDEPENANTSLVPYNPLVPHLPENPSESWLWRTLSSQNLSSKLYSGGSFQSKRQDSATVYSNTKWETIVKSSYLHHDRVRYSEELVPQPSQQSKR